ncbi:MAG: ABC transporter permease [Pirellulaceae bacterium]|nr:ABC transporter permease [Pirellulaceae bacterium]
MTAYLLRRLGHALATIFVAVTLVFLAMRALPGNPLLARFGQHPDQKQMEWLEKQYGWDRPIYEQLGTFYWRILRYGDFAESIARPTKSVASELLEKVPATIELTLAALAIAIPFGMAAGTAAAVWKNRWPDRLCTFGSLLGVSVPVFFLAIGLRALLPWFPVSGRLPSTEAAFESLTGLYTLDTLLRGRLDLLPTVLHHLALPAAALSTIPMAIIARITRGSLLEVLSADYIRTARAKGGSLLRVVLRHALPNAAVPITNIVGLQIGLLLSGAVLTETVFDWPGLGLYVKNAVVGDTDYPAVQGAAIVIATMFVSINFLVDLLFVWLDPRIRVK